MKTTHASGLRIGPQRFGGEKESVDVGSKLVGRAGVLGVSDGVRFEDAHDGCGNFLRQLRWVSIKTMKI
jgi:hypothetical protein